MDQNEEAIGIKLNKASPPPPQEAAHRTSGEPRAEGGPTRHAVAEGVVQKTLSKILMLVNFLPTGTFVTFQAVLPIITITTSGHCSDVQSSMIHLLLGLCALSCFFFHFTVRFLIPDLAVYYGFITPRGLSIFKERLNVEVLKVKGKRFKAGLMDFVLAIMSVMVFLALAFLDLRVRACLFRGHEKVSSPWMVVIVFSGLFLLFPSSTHGVGYVSP